MSRANFQSLDEQAAVRWGEVLLSRDPDEARRWIEHIKSGVADGALADICAATGQSLDEVWAACEATVYRNRRRIVLGSNACQRTWEPSRPCTLTAGHDGPCPLADVPIAAQRKAAERYAEQVGAVVTRVVLARGDK